MKRPLHDVYRDVRDINDTAGVWLWFMAYGYGNLVIDQVA